MHLVQQGVIKTKVSLTEIKRLRKKERISQQEMAQLLKHNSMWSYWRQENGVQPFTAEELFAIAVRFSVPLESLYEKDVAVSGR